MRPRFLLTAVAMLVPMAANGATMPAAVTGHQPLTGRKLAEQFVNRFTFGAQPGEVDAILHTGTDRWLREQLAPLSLDDTDLDHRLAAFPAVQMDTAQLLNHLPTPARVRRAAKGNTPPSITVPDTTMGSPWFAADVAAEEQRLQRSNKSVDPRAGAASSAPAPKLLPRLLQLPAPQRWAALSSMQPAELASFWSDLGGKQRNAILAGLDPQQRETLEALEGSQRLVVRELEASRVLRDLYSRRQVEAVMTDFWLNHFNIYIHKNGEEAFLLPAWERTVRAHALGNFEDLLQAVAHNPAMLLYLDNQQSVGPDSEAAGSGPTRKLQGGPRGLNENYARELMELHTLGVACEVHPGHLARTLPRACHGGYTQSDVTAAAAVLTGWGVDRPEQVGAFRFTDRRHEPGAQQLLGESFAQAGEAQGEALLHHLATSPATAQLICRQLAIRFVSDAPPQSLVDRMAGRWAKSQGNIASVLWTMAHSPEFRESSAFHAKLKTPEEFVFSAVRASGAEVTDTRALVRELAQLGMPLYGMETPQGYSWEAGNWANTGDLLGRMNFALQLAENAIPGVTLSWPAEDMEPEAKGERDLEMLLLSEPADRRLHAQLLNAAETVVPPTPTLPQHTPNNTHAADPTALRAGLLIGSPAFQQR